MPNTGSLPKNARSTDDGCACYGLGGLSCPQRRKCFYRLRADRPLRTVNLQVPFRETHHVSGRAVALAEARQCQINGLKMEDFKSLHSLFTEDIYKVFDFEASVERREAIGGTSRKMVERQISVLRASLGN